MTKSMNFAFKKPEDSPGFLLWQLTNQWQQQQRKALQPLDLTHPQFVALAGMLWLNSQSDNVSQNQVAEFTGIDKMTMSDLIKKLLVKKLIKRLRKSEDKRAYSVNLTLKGSELVLKAIPIVEGVDALFFTKNTTNLTHLMCALQKKGF